MRTLAIEYAFNLHREKNQKYDDKPYEYHLIKVAEVAERFKHLLPTDKIDIVISACYGHDTIEDCAVTYNDVKKATCKEVADLIYNVTNELGKNRKERHQKTYPKILSDPYAVFVKLCDNYANGSYSKETKSRMYEVYKSEYPEFRKTLKINGLWDEIWNELDILFEFENVTVI